MLLLIFPLLQNSLVLLPAFNLFEVSLCISLQEAHFTEHVNGILGFLVLLLRLLQLCHLLLHSRKLLKLLVNFCLPQLFLVLLFNNLRFSPPPLGGCLEEIVRDTLVSAYCL